MTYINTICHCVIFVLILTGKPILINSETINDNLVTLNFGNIDLFNIPDFWNQSLKKISHYNGRIFASTLNYENNDDSDIFEDAHLRTPELLTKYGYANEVHHVVTEDHYILELHRLVNYGGIPVLLSHGLLDSSATWVMMGPNKGLAYFLHENGYDVWMTNARGNTYSRNHTKYSTKHAAFWDFSFHEMGKYDLPAFIDYVLNNTQRQKLHYIGHSQGTLTFWIMCSERPEYSDKVELMQALAPVAFLDQCKSPVINFLAVFNEPINILLKLIGTHEFLPNNTFVQMFSQKVCDEDDWTKSLCENFIFLFTGFDKAQLNETMLPVILGHTPAGASAKQIQHYGQLKRSGHFRQYDYGWIRNHWRYNSINPPEYKLENVRSKIVLHYAENDWLSTSENVKRLGNKLTNLMGKYLINYPTFNHLDFVWGIDARELLYKRVIKLMETV